MRDKARAFAQGYLFPRVTEDYLEERFDREIMTRMDRVGVLGPAIPQALEHVPKKLLDFFDKDMLQLFKFE